MTLQEQNKYPPIHSTICYPNKLIRYFERGNPISLFEVAKTGIVLGLFAKDDPDFDHVQHVFNALEKSTSYVNIVDIDEDEKKFKRMVDMYQNIGLISIGDLLRLVQMVWYLTPISSPYLELSNSIGLFSRKIPLQTEAGQDNGFSFTAIATHKELVEFDKVKMFYETWRKNCMSNWNKKKVYPLRRTTKVSRGVRHEVFKRDNYKCRECGKSNKETILEIDHIISVSKGGTDEISNLQTLCIQCNREKNHHVWENMNKKEEGI